MHTTTRIPTRVAVTLCLAATLGLSGCGGTEDTRSADPAPGESSASPSTPPGEDGVRVIRPGEPGEPAEEGPSELPENGYNDADVAYMTMMVPHHRQALVMSDLAKERAGSPGVRRIAARIRAAQAPEIGMMSRWLEARGEEVPEPQDDTTDMADHMGMDMGMLSADDLSDLVDAEGAEFDELFLDGMIGHHQGAIDMSAQIEQDGSNIQVNELATDINAGQTAEINRMRDLEDSL